jgi:hypothetical protein
VVAQVALPTKGFLSRVEKAINSLLEKAAEEIQQENIRILKAFTKPKNNLSGAQRIAHWALQINADLMILPIDKGNGAVVLNTSDYNQKDATLLGAPTYRRLPKDHTEALGQKTTLLLKKSSLPEEVIQQMWPQGSRPPRLYELPKIHKEGAPLRSILSTIGTPTYRLTQYMAKPLWEHVGHSPRHVKNSMELSTSSRPSMLVLRTSLSVSTSYYFSPWCPLERPCAS